MLEESFNYEKQILLQLGNEYVEEMQGIASGARIPYEDVLIVNCGWDLLNSLPTPETHPDYMCSAFCAWDSATENGNVVCGHNDDGARFVDQFLVFVTARPEAGYAFAAPLVPGYIGYHRMWNDRGVVLFGLAMEKGEKNSEFRHSVPMWILLRYAVQYSASSREVINILKEHLPATAFHFLVTDKNGDINIVEVTGRHIAVMKPQDAERFCVVTNHALSHEIKQYLVPRPFPTSTHFRYQTVCSLLTKHAGKINRNIAKSVLSSHYDALIGKNNPSLNTPCRHGEYEGKLSGTVSSVIIEITPTDLVSEISLGNPCENRWIISTMPLMD